MLDQDYSNLEIVISDNASTDGTREFCEDLAKEDARVRYYRQTENIGPVANYTEVLRLATGELYMNLADDDDLDLSYVSKCVSALEADPRLTMACGRGFMCHDGKIDHEIAPMNLLQDSPAERILGYYETVRENIAFHGVVRRSVLSALPSMAMGAMAADWMFVAAVVYTGRVATVPDTCIRKDKGGASKSMESTAETFGLKAMHGTYYVESIILEVFEDIAWKSPVYASLGPLNRLVLANRAVTILLKRYSYRWKSIGFF
jgi:glycosyltransferase involved in cell wall biosynthesis